MINWKCEFWVDIIKNRWSFWMVPVDIFLARWFGRKVSFSTSGHSKRTLWILRSQKCGWVKIWLCGKGNSGKNQDTVTLVSCEYAHWTLVAQVRPAPDYGGSTSWEIHRCYPILKLSGYLIWIISSIKLGSWSSWQKTLFHKIGSNVDRNFAWSRPCLINLLTYSCLIVACLHFNPCLPCGWTILL